MFILYFNILTVINNSSKLELHEAVKIVCSAFGGRIIENYSSGKAV